MCPPQAAKPTCTAARHDVERSIGLDRQPGTGTGPGETSPRCPGSAPRNDTRSVKRSLFFEQTFDQTKRLCGCKAFADSGHLTVHLRVHSSDKPYSKHPHGAPRGALGRQALLVRHMRQSLDKILPAQKAPLCSFLSKHFNSGTKTHYTVAQPLPLACACMRLGLVPVFSLAVPTLVLGQNECLAPARGTLQKDG